MIYFGNSCGSPNIVKAMSEGRLGFITTPVQGNALPPRAPWIADNGRFGRGWPGHEAWLGWLARKHAANPTGCWFATAPDVVGDASETLKESLPWLPLIRQLGIPAAFVAQDGCTAKGMIPWDDFDVLFLGGTTEFKVGWEGEVATEMALGRRKTVHMGRVNSLLRMRLALRWGCSSVDGTYLSFGPEKNLNRLIRWHNELGLRNFRVPLWEPVDLAARPT